MDSFRRGDLVFDVRDAGPPDGEPVVLLHGFPQDAGSFDRLSPALHQAGLRTLAPDQRGYSPGARPARRSDYRMRAVVDDVLALLDAAGLGSAHVVGHDWGGIAAWALAAWHPWRVRTLTVLSVPHPAAMAQAVVRSDQALRSSYMGFFQLPAVPERVLLAGGGAGLRRMLRAGGLPEDLAERYVVRMQEPGALTGALNWYRAVPLPGRDRVGTVRVPTLHVWGDRDVALGRAAIDASASFVAGPYRLEVLAGANHWLPELEVDRVAELVTAHVRAS
ncbi:MAG: putative hydrolase or acyltransferase of alpha/beta superfamily [Modestobacter sp.]|jgi:pimeloyl-ACP methyl ester carboxylesterase|nr:putative hydrolase or acyltransferase of alpha/beta superfamily [Modestobacter sp.]